ncbi:hypothetical protein EI77_01841 [Prosthecobacter fusiformis]|uniref:Uncharacterized protein n=1 Tax=Prosthecobacter fusiformis TaxID=48464 RepID=A0A4R7S4T7_9BACT|nr:hypothetical protein EI77_01841 [Prosthecobacter fusiformis]
MLTKGKNAFESIDLQHFTKLIGISYPCGVHEKKGSPCRTQNHFLILRHYFESYYLLSATKMVWVFFLACGYDLQPTISTLYPALTSRREKA